MLRYTFYSKIYLWYYKFYPVLFHSFSTIYCKNNSHMFYLIRKIFPYFNFFYRKC